MNLDEFKKNFSVEERTVVWALVNSDVPVVLEELSALLGKTPDTIRNQIDSIIKKDKNLLKESKGNLFSAPAKTKKAILGEAYKK